MRQSINQYIQEENYNEFIAKYSMKKSGFATKRLGKKILQNLPKSIFIRTRRLLKVTQKLSSFFTDFIKRLNSQILYNKNFFLSGCMGTVDQ